MWLNPDSKLNSVSNFYFFVLGLSAVLLVKTCGAQPVMTWAGSHVWTFRSVSGCLVKLILGAQSGTVPMDQPTSEFVGVSFVVYRCTGHFPGLGIYFLIGSMVIFCFFICFSGCFSFQTNFL